MGKKMDKPMIRNRMGKPVDLTEIALRWWRFCEKHLLTCDRSIRCRLGRRFQDWRVGQNPPPMPDRAIAHGAQDRPPLLTRTMYDITQSLPREWGDRPPVLITSPLLAKLNELEDPPKAFDAFCVLFAGWAMRWEQDGGGARPGVFSASLASIGIEENIAGRLFPDVRWEVWLAGETYPGGVWGYGESS